MSDWDASIRITAENQTGEGFGEAADAAQETARAIEEAVNNVRERLQRAMADCQRAFAEGMDFDPSGLNNLADAQETVFRRLANEARNVFEATRTPAERLEAEIEKLNKLLASGAIDAETHARAMAQAREQMGETEETANRLGDALGSLKGLFAGAFAVLGVREIIETADAMQSLDSQIRQVTADEAEYAAVKRELLAVANRTNAGIEETSGLYIRTSQALKDYGYAQSEVLTFTEAVNNAMRVGGVEAQAQASAIEQLSQALGSGVLQGDEFKSIAEAAPILLDTIADYMGKSRAEIKKLGSEGKLTADVIFQAVSGSAGKFAEEAAKMPLTFGQAMVGIQNAWKVFVDKIMNGSGVMAALANAVKLVADNLHLLLNGAVLVGIAALVEYFRNFTLAVNATGGAVSKLWTYLTANPLVAVAALIVGVLMATGELENAMDALGTIASDVFDVIKTGYAGLGDLISAVYSDITAAATDSADGQTAAFGGFFDDCDSGFYGLLEGIAKVFDEFAVIIRTAVGWAVESFADLWIAIKNGSVGAANAALDAIKDLVNGTIDGINKVIDLANKMPGVNLGNVGHWGGINIQGGDEKKVGRSREDIYAEESASQKQSGLFAYAKGVAARNKANKAGGSKGLGGGGGGKRAAGGGGGGKKGGSGKKGGAGKERKEDPMQQWEAEIKAQKLAHKEMQLAEKSHKEWDIAAELAYWQQKLSLVDANSKTGLALREKIYSLQAELAKKSTQERMEAVDAGEKAALHQLNMEKDAADNALAQSKISQLERLDAEIEFENRRYEIALDALNQRIALAEQDPTYSQAAIDKLKQQAEELSQGHERTQGQNQNRREQQRRKDMPTFSEMLEDGGKETWQQAQDALGNALNAMLTRTQNFRTAMGNLFKSLGQSFIQNMVTKPLQGLMQRAAQESGIWQMIFGKKEALETASAAKTAAIKASETTTVVGQNAVQAASGAAASQAGIPYVGPILAVAAMGAMLAAVMGLMGGSGSETSTTTVTRIPSAAGGWDIPAGINPLTQLHENEMVLPAEHAQTIRDMAGQGQDGGTVIINTTGGDFIHKNDLAKLLKQLKRDFKIA